MPKNIYILFNLKFKLDLEIKKSFFNLCFVFLKRVSGLVPFYYFCTRKTKTPNKPNITQLCLHDALFLHNLNITFFSKSKLYYNLKAMVCSPILCFCAVPSCSESVIECVSVVYHALYLEELTAHELTRKISNVLSLPLTLINQVYRQGPTGIHILLSDQVRTRMHIIQVAIALFSVPLLLSGNRSVIYDISFCIFICILQTRLRL